MGYMAHHAVLVHIGGYASNGLADDIANFRNSLPPEWQPLVVGPVPTVVNGDFTAVFLPDGSKEGWSTSDEGDDYRRRFVELFASRYEDGSSPHDVALVRFGGDEPDLADVSDPR